MSDQEEYIQKCIIRSETTHILFSVSPCDSVTPLKNIISGHIIPYDFKNDIINAFERTNRKICKNTFCWRISGILQNGEKAESSYVFWREQVIAGKEPIVILKDDEVLFSRLPTAGAQRDINLRMVLSCELSAVPLSLFHPTGEMNPNLKCRHYKKL